MFYSLILVSIFRPYLGWGYMVRDIGQTPESVDSGVRGLHPDSVSAHRCIPGTFALTRHDCWAAAYATPECQFTYSDPIIVATLDDNGNVLSEESEECINMPDFAGDFGAFNSWMSRAGRAAEGRYR